MDPTNLMIDQDEKNLKVSPYDKPTRHLKKIKIADSILTVDMCMNNSWKRFVINLTKGKYLYAGYRYFRTGWTYRKILIIEQLDFPPLII